MGGCRGGTGGQPGLEPGGITPEALPEPAVHLTRVEQAQCVALGRPGFSRTIELYLRDKPFRVRIPDQQHRTTIWNVQPRPGEPGEFDAHPSADEGNPETAYGLITVMPSWGDSSFRTVIFSGTLSPGTQAASDSSHHPNCWENCGGYSNEGYAGFPSAYQVIVRSNVFGTSALDVQYVAHRVIAK